MRMRLRSAALFTVAMALTAAVVTPAAAAPGGPAAVATWGIDLGAGEASGVDLTNGSARLDRATAFVAPLEQDGLAGEGSAGEGSAEGASAVPTGLLTMPAQSLPTRTDRVDSTVVGDVPAGSTASVDVRGLRANGNWTEWIPSVQAGGTATTTLPEATTRVQVRLVLTGAGPAVPAVSGVTLAARPATTLAETASAGGAAPLSYKVFATREGLVGGTTANGHVIADHDHFVALPSRRALSANGKSDYSVKVCAANGKCVFAPVWDVGPWNTKDDYWNPAAQRQSWTDLPQGTPQAQAAYKNGYNGGRDQYGRKVVNPAGIDLGDGVFWDDLGLTNNAYVTVDYLWTGDVRLSKVVGTAPVDVLAAPDAAAKVVGVAAGGSAVPVQCAMTAAGRSWLQIGVGQFVLAAAITQAAQVRACAARAPTGAPPVGPPVVPPATAPVTAPPVVATATAAPAPAVVPKPVPATTPSPTATPRTTSGG